VLPEAWPSENWVSAMKDTEPWAPPLKGTWAWAPWPCNLVTRSSVSAGPRLGPLTGASVRSGLAPALAEASMGLLQVQPARLRRAGAASPNNYTIQKLKRLFCFLQEQAVNGRQWRALPGPGGAGAGSESCPNCAENTVGVGDPLGASVPQSRLFSATPHPHRLVASVAVTSWPQLTLPGVVLFLNISSCC
jgi:hypothetical protein